MNFEVRKTKHWSSKSGVSEVIGNILILMITVILFSSIMAFVQTMPVPQQQVHATFSAGVTFSDNGTKAAISITHAGGVSLKASQTMILIDKDSQAMGYNFTSDPSMSGVSAWTTGMTWSKQINGTTYSSVITVTVVDLSKKVAVWTSQVTGGSGQSPPIIGQRWVDSNNATPTPDPVLEWDNFSFYVTITDPDNDLNNSQIWINTQQLQGNLPQYAQRPYQNVSGDVYRWDFWNVRASGLSAQILDGATILIHAADKKGHASESTYKMSITKLPVQPVSGQPTYWNTSGLPFGDAGFPSYVDNRYDTYGWGIYGELKVNGVGTGQANTADKRTTFVKDERIFIRVASTTGSASALNNIFGQNTLAIVDSRTGMIYSPNYTGSSNTNPPAPFYPISYSGNAYIYECQFSTFGLPPGSYTLTMTLRNTPAAGKPQASFQQTVTITVTQPGNPIQFTPKITMSMLPDYTGSWGNKSTPFQVSSANMYKIYVSVLVQDATYPPSPSCADVRIVDMTGTAELFGMPPAGNMISKVMKLDANHYNFSIDLRLNNGVLWRAGTNSYTLIITNFNDTNEGLYSLSAQVFIAGAGARADFIEGATGMGSGNQGNFETRTYLYYTQNNNLFSTQELLTEWIVTGGNIPDYSVTAMAVGDVNGDGHKDILVAQSTTNQLYLLTNTLNIYGIWQSASAINRPDGLSKPIQWIAFGDIYGDGHQDFAYVSEPTSNGVPTSSGTIVIYNTTYGSTGWVFNPPSTIKWTGVVSKISLVDMTGDGKADLVVLAGGKLWIYDLKYFYDPTLKPQMSAGLFSKSTGTSTVDFDIADVNGDGHPDIVTADKSGAAYTGSSSSGVNVNYFTIGPGVKQILQNTSYNSVGYKVIAGKWSNGTIQATETAGGAWIAFQENGTAGGQTSPLSSSVKVMMKFQTLANTPDQQLRVTARIGDFSGNPQPGEVFYVWYSVDGNVFVPVMTLNSTTWTTYAYALPSTVMNRQIYVMITDSLSTDSGKYTSYVMIDQLAVYTKLFVGYTGHSVVADNSLICVRAAAIDGPPTASAPYLEIVAAKNSRWDVYTWTGSVWQVMPGQPASDSSMAVTASVKVSHFTGIAPTLFGAVDVNGDGFTDIIVANYTSTGSGSNGFQNSFLGFYMNLYSGSSTHWRYYPVISWLVPYTSGNNGGLGAWLAIVIATALDGTP